MFSLHDFALSALTGMIGNYPDWQVREYAIGWHDKKHLTQEDLAAVDAAIEAYHEAQQRPPEPMPEPPIVDELPVEPEPPPVETDAPNDEKQAPGDGAESEKKDAV